METEKYAPVKVSALSKELRQFIPNNQLRVIGGNNEIGEQLVRLENIIKDMPTVYGQDGLGNQSIVFLHYFYAGNDWYITEKDSENEQLQAYGYAVLNGDTEMGEFGYINIEELKSLGTIELDFYWNPQPLWGILKAKPKTIEDEEDIAKLVNMTALMNKYSTIEMPKNVVVEGEGKEYYTTAEPSYDGFGTKTIETTDYEDSRGKKVRKVFIPDTNYEWQSNRYISGNNGIFKEADLHLFYKKGKDAILSKKVTGKLFKGQTWKELVEETVDYLLPRFNAPLNIENQSDVLSENFSKHYGEKIEKRDLEHFPNLWGNVIDFVSDYTKYPNAKVYVQASGNKTLLPKDVAEYLVEQIKIKFSNDIMEKGVSGEKFKTGETVSIIDEPESNTNNIFKVVGHDKYNHEYGWETKIKNINTGEVATMYENLLQHKDTKQMETQKQVVSDIALSVATKQPLETIEIQNAEIIDNTYVSESNACQTVDTVVPVSMLYEMKKAISTIDRRVNGVDEYVAEKLGYIVSKGCSLEERKAGLQCLCDAYSAEQVDAIAVAIYNIEERGQALIIGDQTGIGKGRIAAGVIRYAIKRGVTPVFLTEKPNLFSDLFRDIIAIGSDDAIPYEFLSEDKKEKTVKATRNEVIAMIKEDVENGDFEEDFNPEYIFTGTEDAKHQLRQLIDIYREKYFESTTVHIDQFIRNKNYESDVVGKNRIVPFVVNGGGGKTAIKDGEGNILYKGMSKEKTESVIATNEIPSDCNLIISTYSQFTSSKETAKKIWLRNISDRVIFILDESHNASGSSNSGTYLKSVIGRSIGATFLSATFAKRPDNMPIYASKTAIQDAGLNDEQLIEAISQGGVALQEILSSQLVAEGQMIRRERSFEGIEVNYISLDASQDERGFPNLNKEQEHRAIADVATDIVRDIIEFQRDYVNPLIDEMDKIAAAAGEEVEERKGTSEAGVSNPPVFNGIFQLIHQMLFSIKAESVAEIAIQRMKEGKKPIIAFASTMESFLDNLTNDDGTPVADNDIINADFSVVLKRRLLSVLRYTVISPDGMPTYEMIDPNEQDPDFQFAYKKILDKITTASTGITISPIDVIIKRIEEAGYSVAEVTGRGRTLKLSGKGDAVVKNRKKINTNDAFRMFNDNQVDCLLINQSGSTGASAHAIPTKKVSSENVKQRVMIILQAELNINTEVQKRGRVNRTGQIMKPIYDYVTSAIPAEKRLMMMLQKKLKSLDANTTSNQKQSKRVLDVNDFLNKYGDKVVVDYLSESPIINSIIGNPLNIRMEEGAVITDNIEDKAHKVSGRIAILSTKMQEDFYNQMAERYASEVDYLMQTGEYDLEVENINLEAEPISKEVVSEGKGKDSLFGRNAIMEKVYANVLKKPFKKEELVNLIKESLEDYTAEELKNKTISDYQLFADAELERDLKDSNDYWNKVESNLTNERKYTKLKTEQEKREFLKDRKGEIENARLSDAESIETSNANKRNLIMNLFKFYFVGKVVAYPTKTYQQDNSYNKGVFLGFDINPKAKNPYAPSALKLRFAIASSDKYVAVPASKQDVLSVVKSLTYSEILSYEQNDIIERWTELIQKSSTARSVRYIVTGNILLAFGNPKLRGKLVSYTTIKGGVKKGILMPEHFDPNNMKEKSSSGYSKGEQLRVNVPIHRALKLIKSMQSGSSYITQDNFSILRTYVDYKVIVPLNKKTGGKFYLNETINAITSQGRFDKSGANMIANVSVEKIENLVNFLSDEFNCSIDLLPTQYEIIKGEAVIDYDDETFPSKEEVIISKLTESDKTAEAELETLKVNTELKEKEAELAEAAREEAEEKEREAQIETLKLAKRKADIDKKLMKLILLIKKN